ncbi:MAG: hypothetical protein M3N53_15035 [Actinomycetota bacterium]|nr:hypothetical protein [Actinomycetota bacterium]
MSVVAPDEDRVWVVAGVSIAAVLLVGLLLLGGGDRAEPVVSHDAPGAPRTEKLVPPPQARWKITTHSAGVVEPVTKAQQRAVARQRPALSALVRRVYDALFVHPGRSRAVLRDTFTRRAAGAFRRSGAGVATAGVASTTLRRADIGIAPTDGARLAVATVAVRAQADEPGATRFLHRSTLWLERSQRLWKVIAFSIDQGRLAEPSDDKKQNQRRRSDDKKRKP